MVLNKLLLKLAVSSVGLSIGGGISYSTIKHGCNSTEQENEIKSSTNNNLSEKSE